MNGNKIYKLTIYFIIMQFNKLFDKETYVFCDSDNMYISLVFNKTISLNLMI